MHVSVLSVDEQPARIESSFILKQFRFRAKRPILLDISEFRFPRGLFGAIFGKRLSHT